MLTQTCPKQHCFIVEIEGYVQDECPKCRERLTTTKTTRLDFENYIQQIRKENEEFRIIHYADSYDKPQSMLDKGLITQQEYVIAIEEADRMFSAYYAKQGKKIAQTTKLLKWFATPTELQACTRLISSVESLQDKLTKI